MDDLSNYRSRIGCFSSNHQFYSKKIKDLHVGKLNTGSFSFNVVFLMSLSLSVICSCQDPSKAKNPGPCTPKPFPHGSPEKKRLFLRLRKLNDDLIKLKSHTTFLQNCLNNDIIPDGLSSSLPNAVAKPDDNLQYKLELLGNSNSFNVMKVIISHYEVSFIKKTSKGINFIKAKKFKRLQKQKLQSTQSVRRGPKILPHGFQNFH